MVKNIILLFFLIIVLLVFGKQLDWAQMTDIKYWLSERLGLPFKRVNVSPTSISVPIKSAKELILDVTNNYNFAIYDVCVEVRIPKGDLKIENIKIMPLDEPMLVKQETPNYWYINYSNNIKQLYSRYIKANSSKELSIKIDCTNCVQNSNLTFKVSNWSNTPAPFTINNLKGIKKMPERFEDLLGNSPYKNGVDKKVILLKIKTPEK